MFSTFLSYGEIREINKKIKEKRNFLNKSSFW